MNNIKSFIRLHLDHRDIIYDKPNNDTFSPKIQNVQCREFLPITGRYSRKMPR